MVKFVEDELAALKNEVLDMWTLVDQQMKEASKAVSEMNCEVARQIVAHEKMVNSFDLKIDSMVEDIIALYTPVAVDLRFVLAMHNINNNLERIGDYAEGLARFVMRSSEEPVDGDLIKALRLSDMFERVIGMLETARSAFSKSDLQLAKTVTSLDDEVDSINANSVRILTEYATAHPQSMRLCLELGGVFRKLERTGDHVNNIIEDIVFYMEAMVLKHSGKHNG